MLHSPSRTGREGGALCDDDFQPGACTKIPKHILLTPRVAVCDATEVDAWMSEQMAKALQPARVPGSHKHTSTSVAASMTLSHQLAQALQGARKPPRQST